MLRTGRMACALLVVAVHLAPDARAAVLRLGKTRLILAGEASASLAGEDDGFYNYSDYSSSALRLVQLTLDAEWRATSRLALLAELRSDNFDTPFARALYLRVRPFPSRAFDLQAGRVPPVFGGFARRRYGWDNPLVGLPLAYQYLTTVRSDALPYDADELLLMRGFGWQPRYGLAPYGPGLPLIHAERWDTGVQVRIGRDPVELSAALTQGTLSSPRVRDDNGGKQLAARLSWRPGPGFSLAASAARGPYLASAAYSPLVGAPGRDRQRAWGLDAEWARGHVSLRAEAVISDWDAPSAALEPLRAVALTLEGRWTLAPALYAAARVDQLDFSRLQGRALADTWDAPVWRIEAGLGYALRRDLRVKAVYQHNWRDSVYRPSLGFLAGQVAVRF